MTTADTLWLALLALFSVTMLASAYLASRHDAPDTTALEEATERTADTLAPGMAPLPTMTPAPKMPPGYRLITPAARAELLHEGLILLAIAHANEQLLDRRGLVDATLRAKQN